MLPEDGEDHIGELCFPTVELLVRFYLLSALPASTRRQGGLMVSFFSVLGHRHTVLGVVYECTIHIQGDLVLFLVRGKIPPWDVVRLIVGTS